jgi:hypothetical protein
MKKVIFFLMVIVLSFYGYAFCTNVGMPPEIRKEVTQPDKRNVSKSSSVIKVGRYLLFQGEYEHLNSIDGKAHKVYDLLKIDTATGQVWRAVSITTHENGKVIQKKYWVPFEELIDEPNPEKK